MRGLLQALVRLYPRAWRQRYEGEFRTLLDSATPRWADAFDLLKEGSLMRLSHLGPVAMSLLGGVFATILTLAVFQLKPVQWESEAILSLRVPYNGTLDSRGPDISFLSMSRENLWKPALLHIVEKEKLYPDLRSQNAADDAVRRLRKNIVATPLRGLAGGGTLISLAFHDRDPYVANQVTRDLASAFEEQTVQSFVRLLGTGLPPELARKPAVRLELFNSAKHSSTNWAMVTGIALAEGSQLGLIFALFRRRAYT